MSKYLKYFGVTCGILAFFFCLCSGAKMATATELDVNYSSLGFFMIGMGFFAASVTIFQALRCGLFGPATAHKPVSAKSKSKPGKKAKPAAAKPAAKPSEKTESKGEVISIYVGNLSPEAGETVLRTAFSGFGEIKKIRIVKDRGRPKGFAFVEMYGKDQAQKAIEAMNGEELAGRPLKVNEAKAKPKPNHKKSRKQGNIIDDEPMRPNIFE